MPTLTTLAKPTASGVAESILTAPAAAPQSNALGFLIGGLAVAVLIIAGVVAFVGLRLRNQHAKTTISNHSMQSENNQEQSQGEYGRIPSSNYSESIVASPTHQHVYDHFNYNELHGR
jgi:uncharacterized protein HemX